MKQVTLPCGETTPALGQGTWFLGDDPDARGREIAALREGIDRGLTLIDTAEMYGSGRSERLVGEAIAGRRADVFLVSKVLPSNAGERQMVAACEASLQRLDTECLDLYLLHWRGGVAFEDTLAGFKRLQAAGKIRHFGISNLDRDETEAFYRLDGGETLQANQLLYNLEQRGIEWDLLPWLQDKGIATMAYSPFDGGDLTRHLGLQTFAQKRDITAGQAALAWLLGHDGVIPIPKSANADRAAENAAALEVTLDADDYAELNRLFAAPEGPQALTIY